MNTPVRVLLLAGAEGAGKITRELLQGFAHVRIGGAATYEAAHKNLESSVWDVALLEVGSPSFDALSMLACVNRIRESLPIVLVSGNWEPEVAATSAALNAGACEFVSMAQLTQLVPVIRRVLANTATMLSLDAETAGSIPQANLIVDASTLDFTIRYVNPVFEQLTDIPAIELIGCSLRVLDQYGAGLFSMAVMETSKGRGRKGTSQWRHCRRNGSDCLLQVELVTIRNERDDPTYFLVVVSDRTHQNLMVRSLGRARSLESAGHLVVAVADVMRDLFGTMRDRRIAISRAFDSECEECLDSVYLDNAAERAERLACRLARWGDDDAPVAEVLDVNTVVTETLRLLQVLQSQFIAIDLKLGAVSSITSDPSWIQLLLLGLIATACEDMQCGGRLTVSTSEVFVDELLAQPTADTEEGWYVQLEVTGSLCGQSVQTAPGLELVREGLRRLGGFLEVSHPSKEVAGFRVFVPHAAHSVSTAGTTPLMQVVDD
jgi:PAS domain-containing protein